MTLSPSCQLGPRYEGQLTWMAEPIPPSGQSSSYSLTTLSSSSSTNDNDNDIQDVYHIVLKCVYYNEIRRKFIKPYYHRHPNMYKFQELMNKSNKRDTFRVMIFINIVMKDSDSTM